MEVGLKEFADFAKRFVHELPKSAGLKAHSIGLKGELGAGKTTFVQFVAKELGVTDTVPSPTFTLLRTYPIQTKPFTKLVHIDAYRLSSSEPDSVGLKNYLEDPASLVFIEWPENFPGGFPKDSATIEFSTIDEGTRRIQHHGQR